MSSFPRLTPSRTVVTSFTPITSAAPSAEVSSSSTSYDDGHYVLHVACGPISSSNQLSNVPLSCALSNRCIQTYDRETLRKVHSIENAHDKRITDLTHAQVASSGDSFHSPLVVTSSEDGFVKIFDLRDRSTIPAVRLGLLAKEEALSVSIGYNGALAAVGSNKGHVRFFDLRHVSNCNSNGNNSQTSHVHRPLGSYVDSHTDEVTKVRFQQMNRDSHETTSLIVSASEDGLACIFDTTQPLEEMALKSVMNIGSPLRDVGFFGPSMEGLFCLTGSETMSVWHHDSAQRISDFGDVRNHLSHLAGGIPIHYLVGCAWVDHELNLLAGNTEGDCVLYKVDAGSISMNRMLKGGHKASIRSFVPVTCNGDGNATCIVTAGEDSRICEWNPNVSEIRPVHGSDHSVASNSRPVAEGGGAMRRRKHRKAHSPY
jgi:FOG: WD40 repeat